MKMLKYFFSLFTKSKKRISTGFSKITQGFYDDEF